MNKMMIIAIDGVSGSGKSTIAKSVARKYGILYIDSGAMYRALTYYAIQKGYLADRELLRNLLVGDLDKIHIDFDQAGRTMLDGVDVEDQIRGMEVSNNVSLVATVPEVRRAMVILQQEIAKGRSVVMDGRDIGTVVFPQADIKLFMVSDPKVRAARRYKELQQKGVEVSLEEVLKNIESRDKTDSSREISPLVQAWDAILIDNSKLSEQEQSDKIFAIIETFLGNTNAI